jgi:ribosomal protein S6--L-glutamate ligase
MVTRRERPVPVSISTDGNVVQGLRHGTTRPVIAIVAEPRYVLQHQPAGICKALERAGYTPLILDLDQPSRAPLEVIDLIVARGRAAPLLAMLARAEGSGVRTINRCSAIAAVRDRASMARKLMAGGLPTPATCCGTLARISAAFRENEYPLIVKPVYGDNLRGLRIVQSREELLGCDFPDSVAVAQRLVPSDGYDLKLYVIGGEVYGLRKPSPVTGDLAGKVQPVAVTPALRALALRCGLLFGLELYGVNCVEMPAGPMVTEVKEFPDYSMIEGADDSLARYTIDRARAHYERTRG